MSTYVEPELWDPPEVCHAAMVDGIDAAERNADEAWAERAVQCIRTVAARQASFTTDAVLAELANWPETTHNLSALGPIMQRLERAGEIVRTGEKQRSRMAQRHRQLTCWSANIVDAQAPQSASSAGESRAARVHGAAPLAGAGGVR